MSERSHLDFVDDISNSIQIIQEYTEDMSFEEFREDRRTIDAVVRNFEIIGEAASNLPEEFKNHHDEIEWRGVVNFRNVMIHDYFQVDVGRVWDTMTKNLPELKEQIDSVLHSET